MIFFRKEKYVVSCELPLKSHSQLLSPLSFMTLQSGKLKLLIFQGSLYLGLLIQHNSGHETEFLCLLKRPQFTRRKKKISFALSPFPELESYQTTSPIFSFPLSDPQTTTFTCWSWYQFSSFFFMMQSPFLPNSSKLDQAASHVNSCVALIILTCM